MNSLYIHVYMHVYIYMYLPVKWCLHVCSRACVCVCVCEFVRVCVRAYVSVIYSKLSATWVKLAVTHICIREARALSSSRSTTDFPFQILKKLKS